MKTLLIRSIISAPLVLAFAAGALGAPLFSNAGPDPSNPGLSTGSIALNGAAAPSGDVWSEVPSDGTGANAIAGFSSHLSGATGAYRFADDFTIPSGGGWSITSIAFFAYQNGAAGPGSPFNSINVRIWSGRPGDAGSTIVFGDAINNRLSSSIATNMLRVFNSTAAPGPVAPDSTRRIWQTNANVQAVLGPGTYWVDWQYTTSTPNGDAFTPALTTFGSRTRAGSNAIQFKPSSDGSGGSWVGVLDTGKPFTAADVSQDFPFLIAGFLTPACPGDADGDGSVGLSDVAVMISNWSFSVTPGTNGDLDADGVVGLSDLAIVIQNWNVTCP